MEFRFGFIHSATVSPGGPITSSNSIHGFCLVLVTILLDPSTRNVEYFPFFHLNNWYPGPAASCFGIVSSIIHFSLWPNPESVSIGSSKSGLNFVSTWLISAPPVLSHLTQSKETSYVQQFYCVTMQV